MVLKFQCIFKERSQSASRYAHFHANMLSLDPYIRGVFCTNLGVRIPVIQSIQ